MTLTAAVKTTMAILAGTWVLSAVAVEPIVSDVVVRQRWPWNRLVDIDYVVTCEATQRVDVTLAAYNGALPLALPETSLSGDLHTVGQGTKRIVWNPAMSGYTNEVLTQFRVELTVKPCPLYMVIDLTNGSTATNYPVTSYQTAADVPGGVTNDLYKTTHLLMRRIINGSFMMGEYVNYKVTLTKDYYIGVYEVTQKQYELVTGGKPSYYNNAAYYATRPVEKLRYNDIRGKTSDDPPVNWPITGHYVKPNTFFDRLRNRTGFMTCDLPTEAQWEYACRAGTSTYYHDGLGTPSNLKSNAQMNVLGRYKYNGGHIYNGTDWVAPPQNCTDANGPAKVGSYQPNDWGLYDMLGNIYEWTLDQGGTLAHATDPVGATNTTSRMARAGSYGNEGDSTHSGQRTALTPTILGDFMGFRVARTLY